MTNHHGRLSMGQEALWFQNFANLVPLRAMVDAGATFRTLARRPQRETVGDGAGPVPVSAARRPGPFPAVPAGLHLAQHRPARAPAADGRRGRLRGAEVSYGGLWLSLIDLPQMEGQFERLAEHYRRYLEAALADPETRVTEVSPMDPDEWERLTAFGLDGGRSGS